MLVGRDIDFNYQKLENCAILLQRGARLVAANLDGHHPAENGINVPETGALIASIRRVVNIEPEIIGKPSTFIFSKAMQRIGLNADKLAIVGDNPYTDIMGGTISGLFTIGLRNNKFCPELEVRAHVAYSNLEELYRMLILQEVEVKT